MEHASRTERGHPGGGPVIRPEEARQWAAKGRAMSGRLLGRDGADLRPITVREIPADEPAEYGAFMLTYPRHHDGSSEISYLPDPTFFLRLLRHVYRGLGLDSTVDELLSGTSRLEVSITNDVLQLEITPPNGDYSMIRHHALMLFHATRWLEEPMRSSWERVYVASLDEAVRARSGCPSAGELARIEGAGFAAMEQLADLSLADPAAALEHELIADVERYLLWASAAIGALWEDYTSRSVDDGAGDDGTWERRQTRAYQEDGYLMPEIRRSAATRP